MLSEDGIYHFKLLPDIFDTEGFLLDQNVNGIPGEPEDAYSFTLIVDTIRPHIVQHSPAADIAGTVDHVDVWFSEPIDKITFTTGQIEIQNPTNGLVGNTSILEVGLNRFRIAFPAQTRAGQYHLLIASNVTDLAGNLLLSSFNAIPPAVYDASFNLVSVDFALANVVASTNQLWVGDPIHVSWQGRNNSGAPLLGSWVDAVYLSPDPFWNITDILLGTVQHTGGLASNEIYSASLDFNVPGLLPGNYRVVVRADVANTVVETAESNNVAFSDSISLAYRTLQAGGPVISGTLTAGNRLHYYGIRVAAGESLRLSLTAQAGVNHLFVNQGSIPTRQSSDFSGRNPSSNQTVTLTGAPGGSTYYLLVSGEQIGDATAYELAADTAPFFVNGITPSVIAGGESDRFWVNTVDRTQASASLSGVGFDESMTVELIGSRGAHRSPIRTDLIGTTRLQLFLYSQALPADVYSVWVRKGIATGVLSNAFTVLPQGEAKLEAHLIVPSVTSSRGGQTLYVEYANTGNRPMPTPLLKVTAYTNAIIVANHLNPPANSSFRSLSGGSGGGGGNGVNVIPTYRFRIGVPLNSVQVMALGSDATPGWLQPGESGRVPVFFGGTWKQIPHEIIQFSVGSVTADDTTLVEFPDPAPGVPGNVLFPRTGARRTLPQGHWTNGTERLFTVPWTTLKSDSRPETADVAGWDAVWSNVISNTGPLWPDYLLMIGDNMNHLARIGQLTNDPGQLFNFEILQASGALNPIRTLAGAVDFSAPGSGFPLVFRRSYRQPILSRFKLGQLGRGWSHNWDISVQGLEQFHGAVVHGPNGVDRLFGRFANGVYVPTGGDTGQLMLTNNLFRLTEVDGTVWQFGGPANKLSSVEDPNGNRITCGYTGALLTSLTHTSGKQLLLQYNGGERLSRIIDPLGPGSSDDRVTTYEYDGSDEHLVRVIAPGNRIISYGYHTSGIPQRLHALTSVIHPDLTEDSFAYDTQGRLVQTSQNCCGGAQQITYAYDSAGTVTVTDATGRRTQLLYGLGGQLAQIRDGEGRIVNFGYDEALRLTQLLGPAGERYRYGYDDFGNLSGIEDPLRQVNSFGYETKFNRLKTVTDARGNALQYAYDNRGNVTAITYADQTRELFGYDARGNVITSTNRRGGVITYAYNSSGQLTSKDYSTTHGIIDFTYAYYPAGNLTNATYWNPQLSTQEAVNLQYDPFTDRLARIEYPGAKWFAFTYDTTGRRTSRADQDGQSLHYLYDTLGRLDRMTNGVGQLIVDYEYDAAGRLARKTLGNGVFTTYSYNNAGQVTQLVNSRADNSVLSSFTYTYDASGRRDSMTTLAGTESYGYDPLGQLTSVAYPNGQVVNYAYDSAGNRTQVTDNGVPKSYTANTLNQYTSAGAATFSYDLDGNLTNKTESATNTIYTYDIENRLIGVATPADNWIYTYDAFGNRTAATHNGQTTRYVIDPTGLGNVAAEYDGNGSLIARYEHGFGLLARTDAAGDPAYYTFSAIGHTSELTDSAGAVANAYAYDPFGLSLARTETIPNPFAFVGERGVMNEENGLQLMRARFYGPDNGRFLQQDVIGVRGGMNLYAYAKNRPSSLRDPKGLDPYNVVNGGTLKTPGLPQDPNSSSFLGDAWKYTFGPAGSGGCGSSGTGAFVPDRIGGIDLTGACANHDACYGDPRGPSKATCDLGLAIDIVRDNPGGGIDTLELAFAYWGGVALFGWESFWDRPPIPNPTYPHGHQNSEVLVNGDPNDKLAPSGYGGAAFVTSASTLAYEIMFENKPESTAPVARVIVTDILDPNVDINTFELTAIAFGDQYLSIPAGLSHYKTILPAKTGANDIQIEVNAGVDFASQTLTLTLTAIDPVTGWWPENPLVGILYPDDDTSRGRGSISYLVKPKPGLPSGTVITNRARIYFDYNDPIDTPLVSNTIDSGPPTSTVAPLPTEAGSTILVQWNGHDDPGGSGLASFDIYAVENGTNQFRWLENTTATSGLFSGTPGSSYSFYSIARDNVGQIESTHLTPDAIVSVPTNAPILKVISNQIANIGNPVIFTNLVTGVPMGSYLFSLGPQSPHGASINPTNGIFRWTPDCSQASRTHSITVWVTDTGNTNLVDIRTFLVSAGDCVVPGLGRVALQTGVRGRLPVNLISSVPLTNLLMTIETATNRLLDFSLDPIVPEICSYSIQPLSNSLQLLSITTCNNQSLIGTQQIAWLNFTTASNQSSAFLDLKLDNGVGTEVDGSEVRNFAPQSGRTVVVGEEPLLEATVGTNQRPMLVLYGLPGVGVYVIEAKAVLDDLIPWQPIWQGLQTNLFQQISITDTNQTLFVRARRVSSPMARLEAVVKPNGAIALILHGETGLRYRIESKTNLDPAEPWVPAWQSFLSIGNQELVLPALTTQTRFFRAVVE